MGGQLAGTAVRVGPTLLPHPIAPPYCPTLLPHPKPKPKPNPKPDPKPEPKPKPKPNPNQVRIEFEQGLSEATLVALKAHWPGLLADPLKPANVSACDEPVFVETWTNASAPAPPPAAKPPLDRPDGQCMREPGAIARRIRSKHGCTTCAKPAATTLGGQLVVCHTLLEVTNADPEPEP